MNNKRIALITGANKGIGFEVARQLSKDYGMTVLLGARDEQRGREAEAKLQREGSDVKFLHLDLNGDTTHEAARRFIEENFRLAGYPR
jgi:NAD(P)-dependent dehydrogenase (short-subunit alcohol dehydrogenase family)